MEALRRVAPVLGAPEAPFGSAPRAITGTIRRSSLPPTGELLIFRGDHRPRLAHAMGFEFGAAQPLGPARDAAGGLVSGRRRTRLSISDSWSRAVNAARD